MLSIQSQILGVNSVTVWYFIHYESLLQNATDIITKCDSYFVNRRFFTYCDSTTFDKKKAIKGV